MAIEDFKILPSPQFGLQPIFHSGVQQFTPDFPVVHPSGSPNRAEIVRRIRDDDDVIIAVVMAFLEMND